MKRQLPAFACLTLGAVLHAAPVHAHPLSLIADLPALREYLALGFTHILSGFDHLLFLAGLILVRGRTRDLLWAITAFTLAHSLTLAMTVLDVLRPNPSWIEALIALSIAYVGLENLLRPNPAGRYRIAFAFGLIHGCGFASALREIGLPEGRMIAALALFNLGVELGQLLVLACVLPLLSALLRRPAMQHSGARALNAGLVAVGLCWAGARVFSAAPAIATDRQAQPAQLTHALGAPAKVPSVLERPAPVPHSIYPALTAAPDPNVRALCRAFAELPRTRRAECVGEAPGVTLTGECERMLDAALRSGALALDPRAVSACVDATATRYADCEFTRAQRLAPLRECTVLWRGRLAAGAACRSSLECAPDLHCQGVSPLDIGHCAAPAAAGTQCDLALDPLASYLPHDESTHRECQGDCRRNRCESR